MNAPGISTSIARDTDSDDLLSRFHAVRQQTTALCRPLLIEDYVIQSAPECSPAKWHLAHTTWFFENFLLTPLLPGYRVYDPQYSYLFNSYYETVGTFFPRPLRGLLSRPTVGDVYQYRAHVDENMQALIAHIVRSNDASGIDRVVLGLHHEQQHQELLVTDIKNLLALNPLRTAYQARVPLPIAASRPVQWLNFPAGMYEFGSDGRSFAFDNETPRHRVHVGDFSLASRPVTNGEYKEFIAAGGYSEAALWLADGWKKVKDANWHAPLYWERDGGEWWNMTLAGFQPVEDAQPVCHVSYFEADAFARWAGKRLPTEFEWELAAAPLPAVGNFLESGLLQPNAQSDGSYQMYGDVWEWTLSSYLPYPGFQPLPGSLGEYNGKFMVSQMVLRGGSCATPRSHIRASYRNFFYPPDRWQFSGFRLAR
ncbi:MAG: ergothioneine biosynthesis protein EgtB [Betaproteobacteria bacterium]